MHGKATINFATAFDLIDESSDASMGSLSSLTNVQLAVMANRKGARHKRFLSMVQIPEGEVEVPEVYANTQMLLKEQERRATEMNYKYAPYQYVKSRSVEVTVCPRELVTLSRDGEKEDFKIDRGLIVTGTVEDQMLLRAVTVVLSTTAMETITKTTNQGQLKTNEIVPADIRGDLLPSIPDTRIIEKVLDFKPSFQGKTTMLDVRDAVLDYLSDTNKQSAATLLYYAHHKNVTKDTEKYKNAMCTYELGLNGMGRIAELEKKLATANSEDRTKIMLTIKSIQTEIATAKQMIAANVRPVIYRQPQVLRYPVIHGILQMWEMIKAHRDVRGENSRKISPFTNGMYYCDLAGDYRGVTAAAALLSSMQIAKCKAIMRIDQGYFKSAWNVLELNTIVLRTGVNVAHTGQTHGTYAVKNPSPKFKILKVYSVGTQPTITSQPKPKVQFSPPEQDVIAIVKSILKQATKDMPVLVVTYGFPELWGAFPGQITAHAHAHAGVVNIFSIDLASGYTYEAFLKRTMAATVQKTYFPFTGKSWIAHDRDMVWPNVRVVRSKLKNVNIFSSIVYQDVTEDGSVTENSDDIILPETVWEKYEEAVTIAAAQTEAQQEKLHKVPSPMPTVDLQENRALPESSLSMAELTTIIGGFDNEVNEWDQ